MAKRIGLSSAGWNENWHCAANGLRVCYYICPNPLTANTPTSPRRLCENRIAKGSAIFIGSPGVGARTIVALDEPVGLAAHQRAAQPVIYIGHPHALFECMTEGIDDVFRRREQAALDSGHQDCCPCAGSIAAHIQFVERHPVSVMV